MAQFQVEDKANLYYMADSIKEIQSYEGHKDFYTFSQDSTCIHEVVKHLQNIGAAAKNLSEELKTYFNDIPWDSLMVLEQTTFSPEYEVGVETIWAIMQNDLPYFDDSIAYVTRKIEEFEEEEV